MGLLLTLCQAVAERACHTLSPVHPLPTPGLTTNEMHKRRELCVAHALQAEAAEVEARAERALTGTGGSSGVLAAESGQAPPHSGQPARPARPRLPNHYDRGVWRNLDEVLRPHHHLRLAAGVGVGGKKAA